MALLRVIRERGLWSAAIAALVLGTAPLSAQAVRASASEVQGVFLFNFAQFVEWPAEAFADPEAPFVIGVLGKDPFGSFLDETVRGETVRGRAFRVDRYRSLDEVKDCQILFISRSETKRLPEILSALKHKPVLTVSNSDDLDRPGGIIRFVLQENRIRLSIDLEGAQAAGLTFSSKLLRSAAIVPPASH